MDRCVGLAAGGCVHAAAGANPGFTVNIDLCATAGTATMPDGVSVPVWELRLGDFPPPDGPGQPGPRPG